MESIYKELQAEIADIRDDLVITIIKQESNGTPLLTGLSSSNWFAAKSKLTKQFGVPGNPSTAKSIAQARAEKTVRSFSRNLKTPTYIINNVDYIEDLNSGSSPKAPAGFVDIELMNALNKVLPR